MRIKAAIIICIKKVILAKKAARRWMLYNWSGFLERLYLPYGHVKQQPWVTFEWSCNVYYPSKQMFLWLLSIHLALFRGAPIWEQLLLHWKTVIIWLCNLTKSFFESNFQRHKCFWSHCKIVIFCCQHKEEKLPK